MNTSPPKSEQVLSYSVAEYNIETTRFYAKVTEEMKREALHKLSDSDSSVFKDDVAFKYANDEDVIKRLCGLK